MAEFHAIPRWLALALLAPLLAHPATLEVRGGAAEVRVKVVNDPVLRVTGLGLDRALSEDDVETERIGDRFVLTPKDPDGQGLGIELPLGFGLEVTTSSGGIEVEGMIHRARLKTDTGALGLALPWRAVRFTLDMETPPDGIVTPRGLRTRKSKIDLSGDRSLVRMRDRLPQYAVTYGDFRIEARASMRIEFREYSPPSGSPVKFPWQAQEALEKILSEEPRPAPQPPAANDPHEDPVLEGVALFRSDVRMVNVMVAVNDSQGRPVTGLSAADFTVVEDGTPQDIAFAGSDSVPFNLVLLLDLSGSVRPDIEPMQEAVRRFVGMARPGDRVAIYALSRGLFYVVTRLTSDRAALRQAIRNLPPLTGASPVYDVIALAYAEELLERDGERNALIVISDGIDNQISKQEAPSSIKFKHLKQAAERMPAILYPVFLTSGERFGRNWAVKARARLEELADAAGGRLFPAGDVEDLEPVYPRIEAELRSVYSVAYYPKNQEFDGGWRGVRVEVARPDATVRARPGYYAR